jgi:hypothetical protein
MADIRREIWKADPYHLVFGAVARCYGNGAWYWSEEGAGLAIDVPMHESYGSAYRAAACDGIYLVCSRARSCFDTIIMTSGLARLLVRPLYCRRWNQHWCGRAAGLSDGVVSTHQHA